MFSLGPDSPARPARPSGFLSVPTTRPAHTGVCGTRGPDPDRGAHQIFFTTSLFYKKYFHIFVCDFLRVPAAMLDVFTLV